MPSLSATLLENQAFHSQIKRFAEYSAEHLKNNEVEKRFQIALAKNLRGPLGGESLASIIAGRREELQKKKEQMGVSGGIGDDVANSLKKENDFLKNKVGELEALIKALTLRVSNLESGNRAAAGGSAPKPAAAPAAKEDDDDDVDLFGSDDEEEDAAAAKVREDRLAAYAAKKSGKTAVIAKSSVLLDIKPWDDETDMKAMEDAVRTISCDGLLWGASKLVPLAYGIKKLTINCVVEDDKVSLDWLQEEIEKFEDFVQSTDIAAFNKI
jgi:elongation factor 1-delta